MVPSYFDLESTLNEDDKDKIIKEQNERIDHLEKKIKQLKLNEANENRTLEAMIQQVEKNLVETTKRAVESERCVEKMKVEIKQLKNQVGFEVRVIHIGLLGYALPYKYLWFKIGTNYLVY